MENLQFSSKSSTGHCQSTSNRNFTTSEEGDICCYKADGISIEFFENMAWVKKEGGDDEYSVQIFAIGDNVYIAHQSFSCEVYVTSSLNDCLNMASEAIYTA